MIKFFVQGAARHIGKSTVALALILLLKNRGYRVGYFKPISHRGSFGPKEFIDLLSVFGISEGKEILNPIIINDRDVRNYLDGLAHLDIADKIIQAFSQIIINRDAVVIEGAGHCAVGSILESSNAQIAKLLDAPIVFVAPGGIGSSYDLITLNRSLIQTVGADWLGVIVNKVLKHKYDQTKKYLDIAFRRHRINCFGYLEESVASHSPGKLNTLKNVIDAAANQIDIEEMLALQQHSNDSQRQL